LKKPLNVTPKYMELWVDMRFYTLIPQNIYIKRFTAYFNILYFVYQYSIYIFVIYKMRNEFRKLYF